MTTLDTFYRSLVTLDDFDGDCHLVAITMLLESKMPSSPPITENSLAYVIPASHCYYHLHLFFSFARPLSSFWARSITMEHVNLHTYLFTVLKFVFLPARRYASAGNSDRNVSVCPSVTRRYCVKTKKASGMISSPSGSPKTLVYCRQISSPNSKGFPSNGGHKQGSVGKIQRFFSFKHQYLENGSRYGQSYY